MIEVVSFQVQNGDLMAHLHTTGSNYEHGSCSHMQFHEMDVTEPTLHAAIVEVERCIVGASIKRARGMAAEAMPESPEVDMGLCKVCSDPVRLTDPGTLRNGPFVYCPKHSR